MFQKISQQAREIINSIEDKIIIDKNIGCRAIDIEMEEYIDTKCENCIQMVVEEIVPYFREKYGKNRCYFAGHQDTLIPGYKLLHNLKDSYVGYWLNIDFSLKCHIHN